MSDLARVAMVGGEAEAVEREMVRSKGDEELDGRPRSDSSEEAMAELLRALQAVPMTFQALEATMIGKTISGLRKHSSEQTASALAAADHAKKAKTAAAHKQAPAATPKSKSKEAPALPLVDDAKLVAAKRKLQEGYKEAASAKKQRMIQVIDAPGKTNWRPVAVVERRRIAPAAATVPPLRMCRAA
ncbi:hypothetical protein E2562_038266 [Oryza meyeriana var. granulata]|uniref:TFIIS N-terminal domain-containing protein n=1 Tax=Oryza meyeriana var. granulata TaxID=110450 RepID=A0A6G1F227_9ORYZ|nr:hypothetical protein E2562_038266 [Oryza meyeriana var. granulata]